MNAPGTTAEGGKNCCDSQFVPHGPTPSMSSGGCLIAGGSDATCKNRRSTAAGADILSRIQSFVGPAEGERPEPQEPEVASLTGALQNRLSQFEVDGAVGSLKDLELDKDGKASKGKGKLREELRKASIPYNRPPSHSWSPSEAGTSSLCATAPRPPSASPVTVDTPTPTQVPAGKPELGHDCGKNVAEMMRSVDT